MTTKQPIQYAYSASIDVRGGGGSSYGGDTSDAATNCALAYAGHLYNYCQETRELTLVVTRYCALCSGSGKVRSMVRRTRLATKACPACRGNDKVRETELERRVIGPGNAFPCDCLGCKPREVSALG